MQIYLDLRVFLHIVEQNCSNFSLQNDLHLSSKLRYILHSEDDFIFHRPRFVEDAIQILAKDFEFCNFTRNRISSVQYWSKDEVDIGNVNELILKKRCPAHIADIEAIKKQEKPPWRNTPGLATAEIMEFMFHKLNETRLDPTKLGAFDNPIEVSFSHTMRNHNYALVWIGPYANHIGGGYGQFRHGWWNKVR